MKKIFSIISAGLLAVLAVSCAQDEKMILDMSKDATVPVLQSYTLDGDLVVTYTPAVLTSDFNQKMPVNHAVLLRSVDETLVNELLSTKVSGNTLTVTQKNLQAALLRLGYNYGDTPALEMVVRATVQDLSRDNGVNGYVDSESAIKVNYTLVEPVDPSGDPYAAYKEVSTWSVIGAIASTGNNWGQDEVMYTDGTWHVAKSIVLTTSDQFKFRKDAGWDTNFGAEGDVEPFVVELGTEYPAVGGGKNLAVPADGTYDLWLNPEEGLFRVALPMAGGADPYADYTESSPWSVIGSIASTGNGWGQDEPMITNGTLHVCRGLVLTTSDQFKFRKDADWGTNFGAEGDVEPFVVELDTEYPAVGGGKNLAVPADGKYDLILDPDAATYKIILAKESGVVDPYAAYTEDSEWGAIGTISSAGISWDGDVPMVTDGEWHVAKGVALVAGEEVKFRKDAKWDLNFGYASGVSAYELGEEFAVDQDGANIKIAEDGTYDLLLNPEEKVAKIIVSVAIDVTPVTPPEQPEVTTWSLIGDFNGWDGDILMTESDGIWKATLTAPEGGTTFKIRKNKAWATSYGGPENNYDFYDNDGVNDVYQAVVGETFAAGGSNVYVAEGDWDITLNLTDESNPTITVASAVPPTWSIIGVVGGSNWDADFDLTYDAATRLYTYDSIALTAGEGFKIRRDHAWTVNRGAEGDTEPYTVTSGVALSVVNNGKNLAVATSGNYKLVYDPSAETITVTAL